MAEPAPPTNPRYVALVKDCLAVAREALLVAGFLMLLILPERFNGLLERAGFTKGSLLGFEWEKTLKASTDQAKGAGDAISQVDGRLKDFAAQLEALDKKTNDVNVKSAIASISRDVQASLQETAKADRAAKSSLLTQQQLIAQVAPGSSTEAAAGWMYLGKTDAPDGKWLAGSPETIETVPTSALSPGPACAPATTSICAPTPPPASTTRGRCSRSSRGAGRWRFSPSSIRAVRGGRRPGRK
jgi:hypothetical protein